MHFQDGNGLIVRRWLQKQLNFGKKDSMNNLLSSYVLLLLVEFTYMRISYETGHENMLEVTDQNTYTQ